jgi:hypothetical protein
MVIVSWPDFLSGRINPFFAEAVIDRTRVN